MDTQLKIDREAMIEVLQQVALTAIVKEINCELRIECWRADELSALHNVLAKTFDHALCEWITIKDRRCNFYYQSKTAPYGRLEIGFSGIPAHFVLTYWDKYGNGGPRWARYPHHSVLITDPHSPEADAIWNEFKNGRKNHHGILLGGHVNNLAVDWKPRWFPMYQDMPAD